jgi:hypothetical protein
MKNKKKANDSSLCRLNPLSTTSIIHNIICRQNENMKMSNKSPRTKLLRGLKSFQHDQKNQEEKLIPFFSSQTNQMMMM